ncbi:hypothetical protein ABPG72_020129 [Tetrahymena utriculariae]
MALQNISEQFLEFLEEQEIDVPEDFIQIFYSSISLDQWISSELAQKYLEYTRKNNFNRALSKFTIDQDYKEITKEQYDETYPTQHVSKIQNQNNLKKQGGHLKKYYLISPDCFKSMLLMRDSEKGRKYQKKNKQLEKKTLQSERRQKKLILSLQQNQQLEQYYLEELQERDQQQLQLEAEIEELNDQNCQQQYRFSVYKIFRENPLQPQVICFSSNIEEDKIYLDRKLFNQNKTQFLNQLDNKKFNIKIQRIIPLFE